MPPYPDLLVITRSPQEERRIQRYALVGILSQLFTSVACGAMAIMWISVENLGIPLSFSIVPLLAAGLGTYGMWTQIRLRGLNRAMRNLRLAVTPKGVAYQSSAGTFFAPWSAVRQVRLRSHLGAPFVVVDALDWGGPAAEVGRLNWIGRTGRLALPLSGSGVDPGQVWQAVYYLSDGAVQVRR